MRSAMKNLIVFLLLCLTSLPIEAQNLYRFYDDKIKKWGVRDGEWNIVIPCIYDEIEPKLDTIFAAKKDGKMMLFNGDGSVRVPLKYQHIQVYFNNFNVNYGIAAVTQNDKLANSWGMIDSHGNTILPEKYAYLRAISPNLLAAKSAQDTMLHFFDRKGTFLYSLPGRNIEPLDFDNTCFGVKGNDRKTRYYTEKGHLVYPDDPLRGIWTDGQRTTLRENKDFNKVARLGLIDKEGKTLIPFEFNKIVKVDKQKFLAEKEKEGNIFTGQILYDYKGKILVPEGRYKIILLGDRYGIIDYDTDKMGLLGANAEVILPAIYRYQSVRADEADYDEKIPHSKPEDYIGLTDEKTGQHFLVTNKGVIIRPEKCKQVHYFSEKHPLIVELLDQQGLEVFKLADKDGRYLLPDSFAKISFTMDPKVFMVRKERKGLMGFFQLDEPEKTIYRFYSLRRWKSGFYCGELNQQYEFYNADFQKLVSGSFTRFAPPEKSEFETFASQKKLSGRLVAAAFRQGMQYGDFLGINEKGEEAVFTIEINRTSIPDEDKQLPTIKESEIEEAPAEPPSFQTEQRKITEEEIYKVFEVEVQPQFLGGNDALFKFLAQNLQYPKIAAENGIQGKVVVSFVVEKDGSLTNVKILRDIGGDCGKEALRLVHSMPRWTPGKQSGQNIRVLYTMPLTFRLE